MNTFLGKIKHVSVGEGGYQDAMFGVSFTLSGEGFGVSDFWGDWATEITSSTKWTHEDRIKRLGETLWRLRLLLADAKKSHVSELVGVPVEVFFNGQTLSSWRILKEVL